MSETNIENQEQIFVIYHRSESLLESVAKDVVMFGFLLFCMYVSRGSTFWTVVCGVLFFLALAGLITNSPGYRKVVLRGKAAAQKWVEKLD